MLLFNSMFKIKYLYLKSLFDWLSELPLQREQSRIRTEFLNLCREQMKQIELKRLELVDKYAEKDKNGQPKIKQDGKYNLDKNTMLFNKEYAEYLQQEFALDIIGNRTELLGIYEILKNTSYEFYGLEANSYNIWMECFENSKVK